MDSREGSFGNDGGKRTGFISHHEEEWRLVGYRVRVVIVGEFSKGNMLCLGSRIGTTKDPKISLHFLIDMFSFSIGLRVISSGEGKLIAEEFS